MTVDVLLVKRSCSALCSAIARGGKHCGLIADGQAVAFNHLKGRPDFGAASSLLNEG
jgi:hypothetical protein